MSTEADIDLLARTIWGESRGEPLRGQEAVAAVVLNRVRARRWANDIRGVILQRFQFSVWNQNDPNRRRMLALNQRTPDPAFRQALDIARRAVTGDHWVDMTGGADHYHANSIRTPVWARGATPTARIGRHVFYRLG